MSQKILASKMSSEKYKYWIKQFIIKSQIFHNHIEEYENSIVAFIGKNTRVTFFKHKEWFYVTYGMNTLRRKDFKSFLKIFGRLLNKKKDQLFQAIADKLIKEIEVFLKSLDVKLINSNIKNYSKFKKLNILIHNIIRIKHNIKTGILDISISKDFLYKQELISFIQENFHKVTRLKVLKNLVMEVKKSLLAVKAPYMFLEKYLKGIV